MTREKIWLAKNSEFQFWLAENVSAGKSSCNLLEKEIPRHISCVGEPSLRDFCSDRVDNWRLLFLGEEMRDRGGHQKFAYMNEKIFVGKVWFR